MRTTSQDLAQLDEDAETVVGRLERIDALLASIEARGRTVRDFTDHLNDARDAAVALTHSLNATTEAAENCPDAKGLTDAADNAGELAEALRSAASAYQGLPSANELERLKESVG